MRACPKLALPFQTNWSAYGVSSSYRIAAASTEPVCAAVSAYSASPQHLGLVVSEVFEVLPGGAREHFGAVRTAVDQAVGEAECGLPRGHARHVGHGLLDQCDHLGAPALVDAVHDERGSVGHRGVGFAGLLPDLESLFGEPLPGFQLATRRSELRPR